MRYLLGLVLIGELLQPPGIPGVIRPTSPPPLPGDGVPGITPAKTHAKYFTGTI